MRYLLAAAMLTTATPAFAAPVYLSCDLPGSNEPGATVMHWDIMLNEEAGTVSYTISNGARVQNTPALFTALQVSWGSGGTRLSRGGGLTINRLDLTFTRAPMQIGDNKPMGGATGKCSVVNTQQRAF